MSLSEEELSTFRQQCVQQHNYYRYLHNSLPVRLDPQLCDSATFWAEYLAEQNALMFAESNFYGQNLFRTPNSNISGKHPVVAWYRTVKYFRFGTYSYNQRARNFLQLIWRSTKQIGVGVAVKNDTLYVVAHYRPGMQINPIALKENVLPCRIAAPRVNLTYICVQIAKDHIMILIMHFFFELVQLLLIES